MTTSSSPSAALSAGRRTIVGRDTYSMTSEIQSFKMRTTLKALGSGANLEAISSHVPTPTLSAAHYLRLASANYVLRRSLSTTLGTIPPSLISLGEGQKAAMLEDLRKAVYAAVLICFVQGLDLLSRTAQREGWGVDLEQVVRIWRGGLHHQVRLCHRLVRTSLCGTPWSAPAARRRDL